MRPSDDRPKLCLRCDWSATSTASACPRCGAPLFRPAAPGVRRHGRAASGPTPGVVPEPPPEPPPLLPPTISVGATAHGRRRRALALVVAGLVLAATGWVLRGGEAGPAGGDGISLSGTLIYSVGDGPGWARLWRWNLETGRVGPGPRIREPTTLVNASGAAPGLMGITSKTAGGHLTGSLLRFLGPSDSPVPLVRGDLVAWGGRGSSVVAVKRGAIEAGCRRIAIVTRTVIPPLSERQFAERVCGDILSVGRDSTSTYFTMWDGEDADILLAGYGRTQTILSDHALLSLSPASDMLVVPSRSLAAVPLAPLAVRAADGPPVSTVFGSALYFRGLSTPRPFGGHGGRLWIDRVLTWANDSTSALVIGRYEDRAGLYQVEAGTLAPRTPLPGPRRGRHVGDLRRRRNRLRHDRARGRDRPRWGHGASPPAGRRTTSGRSHRLAPVSWDTPADEGGDGRRWTGGGGDRRATPASGSSHRRGLRQRTHPGPGHALPPRRPRPRGGRRRPRCGARDRRRARRPDRADRRRGRGRRGIRGGTMGRPRLGSTTRSPRSTPLVRPARGAWASIRSRRSPTRPPASRASPGCLIAISADDEEGWFLAERIAEDLMGEPFRLREDHRAIYHAAAVFASNYLVTATAVAERLLQAAGVPEPARAMAPLQRATVENVASMGADAALTGPAVRGDAGTIERNLQALASREPWAVDAYVEMARLALDVAVEVVVSPGSSGRSWRTCSPDGADPGGGRAPRGDGGGPSRGTLRRPRADDGASTMAMHR